MRQLSQCTIHLLYTVLLLTHYSTKGRLHHVPNTSTPPPLPACRHAPRPTATRPPAPPPPSLRHGSSVPRVCTRKSESNKPSCYEHFPPSAHAPTAPSVSLPLAQPLPIHLHLPHASRFASRRAPASAVSPPALPTTYALPSSCVSLTPPPSSHTLASSRIRYAP
ncbi:unnamed protein product [Chondrus crispus]|uniref:Uncharacterized protein n=1 Tax=Chondrus crispus TaxID=2769 RepID=R7QJP8_CHOCR|nr:unnamed protein product [Chondrus crispus]CDF37696.1 unnamed protein product [Chondrus crispus]|eukprot:XP_005717567.1 unnamed protein product [Chondrus crispus]